VGLFDFVSDFFELKNITVDNIVSQGEKLREKKVRARTSAASSTFSDFVRSSFAAIRLTCAIFLNFSRLKE
jgi:hypothetical protein